MTPDGDGSPPGPADRLLTIAGTVQGVGFRPFVARLAAARGVRGWVRNDAHGVTVRAAASPRLLDVFAGELLRSAPPAARIARMQMQPAGEVTALAPLPGDGFVILASAADGTTPSVHVTPDLAICDDCRHELATPGNRRAQYPFINCTHCGPRYSIIETLPYDRARTTMAAFAMCPECRREYGDPADRRYHAQPNACPACGPQIELIDAAGRSVARRAAALAATTAALQAGRIVAVKGLGGFHLMVDAANEAAVSELRRRKLREEKPLAVMFPSLAALRAVADVDADDERWLTSAAAPIVLLRRRASAPLAAAIAPDNPWIGALLPSAPLHVLLLAAVGRPLVATSGNRSEEPLCFDNAEAPQRLAGIADFLLLHDRPIARPIDDSVLRPTREGAVFLRRARGFAPAPFRLPADAAEGGPLLCVGGHLKNTIAVTAGANLVLSPHLGDLGNPIALAAFRRAVDLLGTLYGGRFERVGCDAHPDYASTRFAATLGLPVVPVQHHLAHILACLLEHGGGPECVLGVAWDGTGFGSDGTVWGGEFIVVDRRARRATRVAHLRPFRLPGGEAAVREPRRCALALAHAAGGGDRARLAPLARSLGFREPEAALLLTLLDRGQHAPWTTSAGRLFDGVAALLGLRQRASFEGQAAMAVEFAAAAGRAEPWPMPVAASASGTREIDWRPVVEALWHAPTSADRAMLAARFHASLAAAIVAVAEEVGIAAVVLTGGCFQNVRLLELATEALSAAGLTVLRHRELPPNDGSLSAGQALGARWGITTVETNAPPLRREFTTAGPPAGEDPIRRSRT
jgi:hydrogenase maturation protein HypF